MDKILALLSDPKVIALVSPLLVGFVKKVTDKLPKWALPVLSACLGAALSAVSGGDLASGAAAGLAGVGVREVVDQTKKSIAG